MQVTKVHLGGIFEYGMRSYRFTCIPTRYLKWNSVGGATFVLFSTSNTQLK